MWIVELDEGLSVLKFLAKNLKNEIPTRVSRIDGVKPSRIDGVFDYKLFAQGKL